MSMDANQKGASERLIWADLIRVIALFGVVLLHSAAVPATQFGKIPEDWWWAANFYDALVRPSVPLFVMVSGALLLDPSRSQALGSFFRRRVSRVVVPLLGWSVIYAGWRIFGRGESMSLAQFGHHLVAGIAEPVAIHLWCMYLILSLYLLTPIFQIYVRHASIASQLYFAGLWIFATGLQPLLHDQLGLTIGLALEPVTGFIGYFILGWTLRSLLGDRRDSKLAAGAAVVFVAGYAVTVIGTWWLSEQKGALDEYFYSSMALNVIAMAVSAYIILREFGIALSGRERLVRWIHITSVLGLGAYLVHALILELLARGSFGLILDWSAMHPIVAIPLTALVAFPMSLAVCAGLRRIPGVRLLVP